MRDKPVLFLFKHGRKARLAENGPREFFYGFTEMARLGIRAELIEEDELPNLALSGQLERVATKLLHPLSGLNAGTLARLASRPALERLSGASALVVATNAHGLALGALKSLGLLTVPVLFLPMGVWPQRTGFLRRYFLARWLKPLSLAPISRTEESWLRFHLNRPDDIAYLPFGADAAFWTPSDSQAAGDTVFSIGNDPHRDWPALAAAWSPALPPLKIVTRWPVPASSGHIEVIAGDWNRRPLSDRDIRAFYRAARFVVLPIQETIQPSGQSACLQAMACGKAVILSKISGLWDDELLRDGETCLLVPPGDPAALAGAAARLTADPGLAKNLGAAAREAVARHFNVERMGESMATRLLALDTSGREQT